MKYLIIDGYNLLHKIPYLKNLLRENPDSAQMTLLEMVKRNINNDVVAEITGLSLEEVIKLKEDI